ncbi:MAG: LPS-assembly protein LptD, partial [Alistipes sp.]|nr:LPS-assembly protein LptD [Alistipes sp.]
MKRIRVKYIISVVILAIAAQMVFGAAFNEARDLTAIRIAEHSDTLLSADTARAEAKSPSASARTARQRRRAASRSASLARTDSIRGMLTDSLSTAGRDSLGVQVSDSLTAPKSDSVQRDTTRKKGGFLEDIINGKNTDSLVYDVKNKLVYIYNQGDITYQNMNLKADFMRVNMDTKEIYAYGKPDSVDGKPTSTH